MIRILQRILGSNNQQIININETSNAVDIIPQDIQLLLDYINDNKDQVVPEQGIFPPDLIIKNGKNGIDEGKYAIIKEDAINFQEIENCLRGDKSGSLQKKYKSAVKILNMQYMARFQGNLSEFVVEATKAFRQHYQSDDALTMKFVALLHYMYSICDLGLR